MGRQCVQQTGRHPRLAEQGSHRPQQPLVRCGVLRGEAMQVDAGHREQQEGAPSRHRHRPCVEDPARVAQPRPARLLHAPVSRQCRREGDGSRVAPAGDGGPGAPVQPEPDRYDPQDEQFQRQVRIEVGQAAGHPDDHRPSAAHLGCGVLVAHELDRGPLA